MSTIQFSAPELANFVACWVESGALPFPLAMQSMDWAIASNARAYMARYNEYISPDDFPTVDEVERLALELLAKKTYRHYGAGLGYNCAEDTSPGAAEFRAVLAPVEKIARDWSDRIERERKRKAENDQAFTEEGPLPTLPPAMIDQRCKDGGFDRVIVAAFGVNETDISTDYFGGRQVREVVIGFGKGKRENFAQLRTAAGQFPATAHLGPNCDRFTVRYYVEPKTDKNDYPQSRDCDQLFTTRADAQAYIEQAKTSPKGYDQIQLRDMGGFIDCDSIEHRENYSMGGGSYLGYCRYGGWSVYSYPAETYFRNSDPVEFFEAPTVNGKPAKPLPMHKPDGKEPVPFPVWTSKGILQKKAPNGYDWPHCYRKAETASADVAKLAKLGIASEVVEKCARGRGMVYIVKRINQAEPPKPTKPTEPPAHVLYAHNC